eukprot:6640346-Alexandrium_andersonii.AAC.1
MEGGGRGRRPGGQRPSCAPAKTKRRTPFVERATHVCVRVSPLCSLLTRNCVSACQRRWSPRRDV